MPFVLLALLAIGCGRGVGAEARPWLVGGGGGVSGAFDGVQEPWLAAEVRPPGRLFGFGGWAAAEAGRHDVWAGAGLWAQARLGAHLRVVPSFGPGWYAGDADGLRLGFPIEMRTAIAVEWEFAGGGRLSLALSHLSNAQLGSENPGVEVVRLMALLPVR